MENNVRIRIYGKNLNVFDDVKAHIEKQAQDVMKFCDDGSELSVVIGKTKNAFKTEITARCMKRFVRVEKAKEDVKASITDAFGTLDAKLSKIHSRVVEKRTNIKPNEFIPEELEEIHLVKNKHFNMQLMLPEEACVEMEMLGHPFFVFKNKNTNELAVVYKREDGSYGLIEEE